jgi:hypothetical protein
MCPSHGEVNGDVPTAPRLPNGAAPPDDVVAIDEAPRAAPAARAQENVQQQANGAHQQQSNPYAPRYADFLSVRSLPVVSESSSEVASRRTRATGRLSSQHSEVRRSR